MDEVNNTEIPEQTLNNKLDNSGGEPSGIVRPGFLTEVTSPPISNINQLNIDCLQEMFAWIPLYELIKIGQTCTRMQRAAGDFFRSKYLSQGITGENGSIWVSCIRVIDIFSDYITKICISEQRLKLHRFVGLNCKSLRQIRLDGVIPDGGIESISEVLNNIEILDSKEFFFREEFFDYLLKYCSKLKSLSVKRSGKVHNTVVIIGSNND